MRLRILAILVALLPIPGSAACDKIPLLAPTGSSITLSAPKRILALNESVEITAVVLEQAGTPVQNGTTVRFTSSLGRVNPIEVETRNGIATVVFSAGDVSGTADVRASSGAAGGATTSEGTNATSSNVITFTIGAAAADSISIRANPSTVSATGGTVDVIATLLGANGQPIAGVPITFTVTSGGGTLTPSTATTDASGNATVRLTTNVETIVTASGGGKTTATGVTVRVQGTPAVTLTCSGTAGAAASCSQLVGQPVSFTAARAGTTTQIVDSTLEFGDGITMGMGSLTNSTTVTHPYDRAGTYTATLRAVDVNGQRTSASVSVNITSRPPIGVTFTATADPGTPTTAGQRWTFAATVTREAGDTGVVQRYIWDFGDGTTAETSGPSTSHIYTRNGRYTVTLTVQTNDGREATARNEILITAIPSS